MQLTAKITNLLSSAEGLLHLFQGLSICAGVLTVSALVGIALTSRTVSRQNRVAFEELKGNVAKQEEDTSNAKAAQQRVETELAEAKTRQAEAETKLEEVRKRQERRLFDMAKFQAALSGKPNCDIEILCQPNDDEAYGLAGIISLALASSGWPLVQPVPIPEDMGTQPPVILEPNGLPHKMSNWEIEMWTRLYKAQPPTVRAGAGGAAISSATFGLFVASNKDLPAPLDLNTAQGALVNAFNVIGLNAGVAPANRTLPDNKLRIIVGSKP